MQTLNQCYSQLHQQQVDLGFLQGQFQQLFSANGSPIGPSQYPPPPPSGTSPTNPFSSAANTTSGTPAPAFPSLHVYANPAVSSMYTNPVSSASNSFNFSPFQMGVVNETPGFTPATLNQSDLQWPRSAVSQPGNLRAPSWMPVFTDATSFPSQSTQTDHMANPDTGVPSPRYSSVPRATATDVTASSLHNNYNPSAYAGN